MPQRASSPEHPSSSRLRPVLVVADGRLGSACSLAARPCPNPRGTPSRPSLNRRCARMEAAFGGTPMQFEVGETVVYPHHGAAKIVEVKKRTVRGEEKTYLKLTAAGGALTIEVPGDTVALVGVGDVTGGGGLDRVLEVLPPPFVGDPTTWSRRYKANLEKLA